MFQVHRRLAKASDFKILRNVLQNFCGKRSSEDICFYKITKCAFGKLMRCKVGFHMPGFVYDELSRKVIRLYLILYNMSISLNKAKQTIGV